MTCAIPAVKLSDVVAAIERNADADATVARYAAEDAQRFARLASSASISPRLDA